jgi:hypothetical protein
MVESVRLRWIGIGAVALGLGFALVLLRGEPSVASDQGVFLSVAARLLDGDHLYSQVVDNKDPLFLYTYAAALWIGGWRGPFLLDGIWLGLAALAVALLVRELRAPRAVVVASFLVYPLALTSGWYLVGMSMLAALAIAPLAPWLWLRGRFAWSGAAVAIAMLFKLNLAPVVAAPLVAFVLLGAPSSTRPRSFLRAAAGLGGVYGATAVILAVRGELSSYLQTITYNLHYSSARYPGASVLERTRRHLAVPFDYFRDAGRWQLPLTILILAAFAASCVLAWRAGRAQAVLLAAATAATLVLALAVLAFTAYWREHLQMLAYPATLIGATILTVISSTRWSKLVPIGACAFVVFALWSSLKNPGGLEISTAWRTKPISAGAIALERARTRLDPRAKRLTYMVFGSNSENGHAAFIGHQFDLVCRWFQLYPFSSPVQFDETSKCAKREKPEFVLVTLGFFDTPADGSRWAAFVADSRDFLDHGYKLVEEEAPGFQVWRRTTGRAETEG